MYDLETLRRLNEDAVERALQLAEERRQTAAHVGRHTDEEENDVILPLAVLAEKLNYGPPLLRYIAVLLEDAKALLCFEDLVNEYLPESAAVIMNTPFLKRAVAFSRIFSRKYFPMGEYVTYQEYSILDITSCIPWQPLGFSSETFHNFNSLSPGYIMLLSIAECMFQDEGYDEDLVVNETDMPGSRIPILKSVQGMVGKDLVDLIPTEGWGPDYLHKMTDGTEFDGVGDFADWINGITGTMHLDTEGQHLESGEEIEWSVEEVESLTYDWERASEILDKIHKVARLLESQPEENFKKLMMVLLDNPNLYVPKEQLALPVV
jgi:hypothetical protein